MFFSHFEVSKRQLIGVNIPVQVMTLTLGLLINNPPTVHRLSVRRVHVKLGKKESEGCFLPLLQPELARDTEFNATTLSSAADLGNMEKENSGFDEEAEVKNSS